MLVGIAQEHFFRVAMRREKGVSIRVLVGIAQELELRNAGHIGIEVSIRVLVGIAQERRNGRSSGDEYQCFNPCVSRNSSGASQHHMIEAVILQFQSVC